MVLIQRALPNSYFTLLSVLFPGLFDSFSKVIWVKKDACSADYNNHNLTKKNNQHLIISNFNYFKCVFWTSTQSCSDWRTDTVWISCVDPSDIKGQFKHCSLFLNYRRTNDLSWRWNQVPECWNYLEQTLLNGSAVEGGELNGTRTHLNSMCY